MSSTPTHTNREAWLFPVPPPRGGGRRVPRLVALVSNVLLLLEVLPAADGEGEGEDEEEDEEDDDDDGA